MSQRLFHFALTGPQAEALLDLLNALDGQVKLPPVTSRAFNRLDEQLANQDRQWERCETCDGSGWVEQP